MTDEYSLDELKAEQDKNDPQNKTECKDEQSENDRVITTKSADIKSLEDLVKYSGIDLKIWKIVRHVINSWEVTIGKRGTATGKPETYTNYQVKAWLEKITGVTVETILEQFIEDAVKHSPIYPDGPKAEEQAEGVMVEISIPDLHFGLLSWAQETGDHNYDIKISETIFIEAVEYLLSVSGSYLIDRVLFVIGNDFFNVNSALNITAAGTPQDEDVRWQKTFSLGRRMCVEAIDRCRTIAPVDVVIVPGNHDVERSFYLGESLEAWYHNTDNVEVDNRPLSRKYRLYGNSLIGFEHGRNVKLKDLPLVMADEVPDLWAKSKFREIHTADKHHDATIETRGVRVRTIPSLAPASAWMAGKAYRAVKEAQVFVWSKENGNIALMRYHPEDRVYE